MTNSEQEVLQRIFVRLQDYLLRERGFLQQGLNRTTLAVSIRTNEKYLTKAVRVFSGGKSIGEYLDSLRMEYACSMLKLHPEYTVDAIAMECGMASRSAFYRTFRKHLRCSPGEYRDRMDGFPDNETFSSQ